MEEKRRARGVGTLRSDFLAAWGKLKPGDLEALREQVPHAAVAHADYDGQNQED